MPLEPLKSDAERMSEHKQQLAADAQKAAAAERSVGAKTLSKAETQRASERMYHAAETARQRRDALEREQAEQSAAMDTDYQIKTVENQIANTQKRMAALDAQHAKELQASAQFGRNSGGICAIF